MKVPIKKIILATDFSKTSKDASDHALMLAQNHKAELKALHVFDRSLWTDAAQYYPGSAGPFITGAAEKIEEAKQRGKDTIIKLTKSFSLNTEAIFTVGDPGHEIIRVAEELNADLIVLGTHGYGGWKRFTIGSVAEFVVRHAPCAVLTIKPKKK